MDKAGDLANTVGAVLDPVLALRARLVIGAGESQQVAFTTFLAKDRDEALARAARYRSLDAADEIFRISPAESDALLTEIGIAAVDAARFQDLAGSLLFDVTPAIPAQNNSQGPPPGRADLLSIGITGEWPILVAALNSADDLPGLAEILALHGYWRAKGVGCDLVVLCDAAVRDKESELTHAVAAESERIDRPRGVFVRWKDELRQNEIAMLEVIARICVNCKDGLSKDGLGV